ncbi:hypothetical protein [Thiobacillus sp. 0-1251]|uniref:hypothetical protein n=1 Tax=Thiobacillus sp. 0-1251 TaxID=1895858 RepID=UPI00095C9927|nr:hypothetical protein [Thiobacillus sp. 0-1251]OJY56600.1 MAG: hypothetical protein BGP19_04435 [Thiobacillus sp. 0-1251]
MADFLEFEAQKLRAFLDVIRPWSSAYADATFGFVGIRNGERISILHGHLILGGGEFPTKNVEAGCIVGGIYRLADFGESYESALEKLSTGVMVTPYGDAGVLVGRDGRISAVFNPHPFGFANAQSRVTKFSLYGAQGNYLPSFDELTLALRAAEAPYDSIEEFANDFAIAGFRRDIAVIDVTANNVAAVDLTRKVVGNTAGIGVMLASKLDPQKCSVGYKVVSKGQVIDRKRISGEDFQWSDRGTLRYGTTDVPVPQGSVVQCFASYSGHLQHHGWIADPDTFPNVRRVLHHGFDSNLEGLKTYLFDEKHQEKNSRDFEVGVSNLLFMLGFSVDPLIGKKLESGPDIVATTNNGDVVLVECTINQINKDGKLGKLVDRAEVIRSHLDNSAYGHLRVLPVIVTARPKDAVGQFDVDAARSQGVLIITKENLMDAIERSVVSQDPDKLFALGWESLHREANSKPGRIE